MNGRVARVGALIFLIGLAFMLLAITTVFSGNPAGFILSFGAGFAIELIGVAILAIGIVMKGKAS